MTSTRGFKKVLYNSGFLLSEKAVSLLITFLVSIYVVRYLGPSQFGLLEYTISLVAIALPIGRLGTTHLSIRDLVTSNNEEEGKILGTVFTLVMISGSLLTLVILVIGNFIENEATVKLLLLFASSKLFLQGFEVFDSWFQSKVRSKYTVYGRMAFHLSNSGLKLIFTFMGLSLVYFGSTVLVGLLLQVIIWTFFYQRLTKRLSKWTFDKVYAKNLLKNSWPLIISGLSLAIYMKIDQVMLRNMVDNEAVGNYAVAVKLSELWYFLPMSIIASVFPSIIKAKLVNKKKYDLRMQQLYDLMVAMALVIAVPITFLGEYIIDILYGHEYIAAAKVLIVHIWAGIFVFIGVARSKWIVNENLQKMGMIFNLIGAGLNVVMNLLLIPYFGIMGAAVATVLSQAASAWFLGVFSVQTRDAFKMQSKAMFNVITIIPLIRSARGFKDSFIKN